MTWTSILSVLSTACVLPAVVILDDNQAVQWSAWGGADDGLQCRVSILSRVEQGSQIEATVEFRRSSSELPAGVESLDTFLWQPHYSLELVRTGTDRTLVVMTNDPTSGMPVMRGERQCSIDLGGTAIESAKLMFPIARMYDDLVPGEYTGRVRFSPPGKPRNWPREKASPFWHGTIKSGKTRLEIIPQRPKTKTFLLPSRLRLVRRSLGHSVPAFVAVSYLPEDAEEATLTVRNGHFVGTAWKSNQGTGGLQGGPPAPNGGFDQVHQYNGGGFDRSYKITLFETCEPAGHFWSPQVCGYRVLWEKTFNVRYSDDEVKALLKK